MFAVTILLKSGKCEVRRVPANNARFAAIQAIRAIRAESGNAGIPLSSLISGVTTRRVRY